MESSSKLDIHAGAGSHTATSPDAPRPVHGGIRPAQLRALGLDPQQVLDFSASISPLGPPEGLWGALQQVDLTAYPDPECLELREALCRHLDPSRGGSVTLENILVGNGSTELIHLLARAYVSASGPPHHAGRSAPVSSAGQALLLTPTYGEYDGACRLVGATVSSLDSRRAKGFSWDLEEAAERIVREGPGLVFVCNPNNPTGVYLQQAEVEFLARAVSGVGGLLVLDEAYLSFVEAGWDSLGLLDLGNVALLRSMTKDYALTGLRLGYSLASPEVTARMAALQPDWSVNSLAQVAGLVALADAEYLPRARKSVEESKEYLTGQLASLGFTVLPGAANFLLVEVGDGAAVRDRLMRQGLFVRDCASFGLPDCIRIGIRPLDDCRRLVAGLSRAEPDSRPI
jgi:histidinol-phosphate aminotransferase